MKLLYSTCIIIIATMTSICVEKMIDLHSDNEHCDLESSGTFNIPYT